MKRWSLVYYIPIYTSFTTCHISAAQLRRLNYKKHKSKSRVTPTNRLPHTPLPLPPHPPTRRHHTMPNRPRRNAAAVASIRMEDSFEDIESNSSVSPTPPSPSPTPVRQKKLKQLPVVKSAQKQRAKQVQKNSVQKKTHVTATVERPRRAAAVATYDSGDEDSLTDEMRGRLLPFILNFDDEEQDRIRPGSRSACYLDSDDEKMGVTARLRIVQEEASSSNRKRKKDRREARTTSRKKKAQAPEKAIAKKSRYTPLTIISTGRGVGSSGKSKTKGKVRRLLRQAQKQQTTTL